MLGQLWLGQKELHLISLREARGTFRHGAEVALWARAGGKFPCIPIRHFQQVERVGRTMRI